MKPPLQFPPGCGIFDPLYSGPEYRFAVGQIQESGNLQLDEQRVVLPNDQFFNAVNDGHYQVEIPYAVRVDGQYQIKIRTETRKVDGSPVVDQNATANDRDLRQSERTAQISVPALETYGSTIVIRTLQQTRILENDAVPSFSTESVTSTYEPGTFALLDTGGVEVAAEDQNSDAFPVLIVSDKKYIGPFLTFALSKQMRIVILQAN